MKVDFVEAWLGPPFGAMPGPEQSLPVALHNASPEQANRLVLAHMHHCVCTGRPSPLASLPAKLVLRLPHPRVVYERWLAAAGRAFKALAGLAGNSERMRALKRDIWSACFGDRLDNTILLSALIRDHDVLLLGETGTGKDVCAQAIQAGTPGNGDQAAPHATINAAALPQQFVESELFGHTRGAFTGAVEARGGRVVLADRGTFFLDEVGDLPLTTQVKLLRMIENDEFYPLGADAAVKVDVRYVAATHKHLQQLVREKSFRQDLYERLAGFVVVVPPLRDHVEDIEDIGRSIVDKLTLSEELRARAYVWLQSPAPGNYHWPGNVRELQNALRTVLLGGTPSLGGLDQPPAIPAPVVSGDASLRDVENWYIASVLHKTAGNITHAAKQLGIDRSTLRRRLADTGN